MSTLFFDNHSMRMEVVLEKLRASKAIGEITVRPLGEIKSIPLNYVHDYIRVFFRIRYELLRRGIFLEYVQRKLFGKALSYSYYQKHRIEHENTLFTLSASDRYHFQSNQVMSLQGYTLLRCVFTNHQLSLPNLCVT